MPVRPLAVEFDEKKIDAIFADLDQCHLPGAAVGIAIGGRPVYRKGFGLASMELPVVLSPSMRLRLGSTSKHFTCLAYLLLCEEGKAGIDDPLEKYLPELHPVTHRVTMRQLMGSTGGLRDAYDICFQFSGMAQSVTSDELLTLYRDMDDANATPGSAWVYNNGGWLMLSVAIERITGQRLEQVMAERLFTPIGMHDTLLRRLDTDFVPNSATQHALSPAGGFERLYWGLDNIFGAGAIVSTVDDMLRWLAHMDTPTVGSAATWTAMKTPQRLASGTSTGYGLGLMIDYYRGVETLSHAGNALGGNAQMLKVPAAGLDVTILVNRQDVSGMQRVNQILDACLPQLEPVKAASSRALAQGTYRSPTTGRIIQLFAREGQQIASVGGVDLPVAADDDGVLWYAELWKDAKQGFTLVGDPAQPTAIQYSDFGNRDELVRLAPIKQPDPSAILGRYRSESTGTDATITRTDTGAQLVTVGRFGSTIYNLECLAENVWRTRPARLGFHGGIVSFDTDGGMFRFSSYQTWTLPFRRCE